MEKQTIFRRFRADQKGATAIEYALICGIMSVALVSVAATGGALGIVYERVSALIAPLGGESDPPEETP